MLLNRKTASMSMRKWKERGFLLSVWVYPIVLFFILYIYININSILLAFKTFDVSTQTYFYSGFGNFINVWNDIFFDSRLQFTALNSLIVWAVHLFFSSPLSILVSFFLYKKIWGSGIFKVILFIPSLMASIVWVLLFKYLVEYGVPQVFEKIGWDASINLLGDNTKAFGTMLFFTTWMGFSGGMLVYLGSMTRIPPSLVESGKLDGMNLIQEFVYITLPLIFPVISIILITALPSFFNNQMALYAFYQDGASSRTYTFGYYIFAIVIGKNGGMSQYPYASAAGLLFTVVVAPLTLLIKYMVEKYGPVTEY